MRAMLEPDASKPLPVVWTPPPLLRALLLGTIGTLRPAMVGGPVTQPSPAVQVVTYT